MNKILNLVTTNKQNLEAVIQSYNLTAIQKKKNT
jgi:hypothetical protein